MPFTTCPKNKEIVPFLTAILPLHVAPHSNPSLVLIRIISSIYAMARKGDCMWGSVSKNGRQRKREELTSCLNQGNGNLPLTNYTAVSVLGHVEVELRLILAPMGMLQLMRIPTRKQSLSTPEHREHNYRRPFWGSALGKAPMQARFVTSTCKWILFGRSFSIRSC